MEKMAIHKNILVRILKDIYSDPTLGPFLGFKGGTAAYFFYNLGRFSVDLDFDLLDESHAQEVFVGIEGVLAKYGAIKQSHQKRFTSVFVLSYTDKVHKAWNIKIEINLRQFGSTYEVKSYLGIPMNVMVPSDMFAHKLVAMNERIGKANRDIFDVWSFLQKNWPINEAIIQKRTGLSLHAFLERCAENLEKLSNHGILAGIGDLLDSKQKIWAKNKLLEETIFLLRLRNQQ